MRGLWVALAACSLLAASCADDAPPRSSPVPTPAETVSPTPTDDPLAGASCEQRQGGDPANTPDFTEVRIEPEGDAVEKVDFRFEGAGGATDAPQWFAGFVDELITDGEGAPVEVEGEAFLSVAFMARGVDLSGETFEPIYTGPTEFTGTGLSTVLEVEQTGDFEGLVSWGIGLSHEACFVVDEQPDRLTLEFPVTP